jgi:hypothetical protein
MTFVDIDSDTLFFCWNLDSVVKWRNDILSCRQDYPGLESKQVQEAVVFSRASIESLEPIQISIQCVPAFLTGDKVAEAWTKLLTPIYY